MTSFSKKSLHTRVVNLGPPGWLSKSSAIPKADGSPGREITSRDLENHSTITMMTVLLCDAGRSVMKSIVRFDHGLRGVGSGRSLQCVRDTLALMQTEQNEMKWWRSWGICGHQYLPCSSWCVLCVAGEVWAHVIKPSSRGEGTNFFPPFLAGWLVETLYS